MSPVDAAEEPRPDTRTRLLSSAAELFGRQGFGGTGIKAILAAAEAPYGSLYHFFPSGKQELGVAAVAYGSDRHRDLIEAIYQPETDVRVNTQRYFKAIADGLESTGFEEASPVATIALESATTDDVLRAAASAAFESWLAVLQDRLIEAGLSSVRSRGVAMEIVFHMQGAVMLARTLRSTEPVRLAGASAEQAVSRALEAD